MNSIKELLIQAKDFPAGQVPKKEKEICEICLGEVEFEFLHRLFENDIFKQIGHDDCQREIEKKEFKASLEKEKEASKAELREKFDSGVKWFFDNTHLPLNAKEMTFENFVIEDIQNTQAIEELKLWRPDLHFGFIIIGPTGTGKTHLLFALINKLFAEAEKNLVYPSIRFENTSTIITSLLRDKGYDVEKFKTCKFLFLDDIGSENASEWSNQQLFEIINYRYNNKLATFFSSNFDIADLRKRIGERNVSRIFEIAYPVTIHGKDKRIAKLKFMKSMLYRESSAALE